MRCFSRIACRVGLASSLVWLAGIAAAGTGDWPQFHGPNRDAISTEKGLLQRWPAAGPKLLWTLKGLGRGFSNIAIADGKFYTVGDRGKGDAEQQMVEAYDLASRRELKYVTEKLK